LGESHVSGAGKVNIQLPDIFLSWIFQSFFSSPIIAKRESFPTDSPRFAYSRLGFLSDYFPSPL
jgi:hypothetical protein